MFKVTSEDINSLLNKLNYKKDTMNMEDIELLLGM